MSDEPDVGEVSAKRCEVPGGNHLAVRLRRVHHAAIEDETGLCPFLLATRLAQPCKSIVVGRNALTLNRRRSEVVTVDKAMRGRAKDRFQAVAGDSLESPTREGSVGVAAVENLVGLGPEGLGCRPSRNSLTLPSRNSLARREADVYSMAPPFRPAPG